VAAAPAAAGIGTAPDEDLTPEVYDDNERAIHFRRFDRTGRALDADWLYPGGPRYAGADLVWTGSGFAAASPQLDDSRLAQ